jgi:hypothetical protein
MRVSSLRSRMKTMSMCSAAPAARAAAALNRI